MAGITGLSANRAMVKGDKPVNCRMASIARRGGLYMVYWLACCRDTIVTRTASLPNNRIVIKGDKPVRRCMAGVALRRRGDVIDMFSRGVNAVMTARARAYNIRMINANRRHPT